MSRSRRSSVASTAPTSTTSPRSDEWSGEEVDEPSSLETQLSEAGVDLKYHGAEAEEEEVEAPVAEEDDDLRPRRPKS